MGDEHSPRLTDYQTATPVNGAGSAMFANTIKAPRERWIERPSNIKNFHLILFVVSVFAIVAVEYWRIGQLHDDFVRFTSAQTVREDWAKHEINQVDQEYKLTRERLNIIDKDYGTVQGFLEGRSGQSIKLDKVPQ